MPIQNNHSQDINLNILKSIKSKSYQRKTKVKITFFLIH